MAAALPRCMAIDAKALHRHTAEKFTDCFQSLFAMK
jgi:hypothetical protein